MTARKTDLQVGITTGKSSYQGDPVRVTLRVQDGPSGELLVELEFDANTWWDVLTGSHRRMTGLTTGHPERLGREMVVRQVKVPREVHDGVYGRGAAEPLVEKWAKDQRCDGETMEYRQTNSGWVAIYRSWPEVA
jgi:hypothetical protein